MPRFMESYVGFRELGGISVSAGEVVAQLQRLPLDGVLGALNAIALDLVRAADFADPRVQGGYLSAAIADDFPEPLFGAAAMYVPGHVPITGGRHLFIHEQNLLWLAHGALLHSRLDAVTETLDSTIIRRTCRLLLIGNDLIHQTDHTSVGSLEERRQFGLQLLRSGQFNRYMEDTLQNLCTVARQQILYCDFLPQYHVTVDALFKRATGLDARTYFHFLTLLTSFVYQASPAGPQWLRQSTVAAQLRRDRDAVDRVFMQWAITPAQYRATAEAGIRTISSWDFTTLRRTPLIESRPDELIAPVVTMLLAKIQDGPYFTITDYLGDDRSAQSAFQRAHGEAFAAYASGLVRRIALAGRYSEWISPKVSGSEITDHYVQSGDSALAFEFKALRAPTEFLTGGTGDRVLGPPPELVDALDGGLALAPAEGKRRDKGMFTRGLWQHTQHGASIREFGSRMTGVRPARVYPLYVHLAPFRVDETVYRGYLAPLCRKADLLAEPWWQDPQWLHVEDLESLAGFAEEGEDVMRVLSEKVSTAPHERFDVYLYDRFGNRGTDPHLIDAARNLLRQAASHYFDHDLGT